MTAKIDHFDRFLQTTGPAAIVIREWLTPVEGPDGVAFPATFAAGDNFPGGYNIDAAPDGTNVCLIDTVGAQANRIEPLFKDEPYDALVPQIVVKSGEVEVNLLEAGHRAADAIVRCSSLQEELENAFRAVLRGDAEPLGKTAPTSLVFGVWDSRGTQAKLPRLVASTIRAFNVQKLNRGAQYNPATAYVENGLLEAPEDTKTRDAYAERGFVHVPATGTHGGVIAKGGIRRDATLSLAALRTLRAGKDAAKTLALRRYVLGLALVALTHPPGGYVRAGCHLVRDNDSGRQHEYSEVGADGVRTPCKITHEDALAFAKLAAEEFGVGESRAVEFDKERAKKDVSGEEGSGKKKTAKKAAK